MNIRKDISDILKKIIFGKSMVTSKDCILRMKRNKIKVGADVQIIDPSSLELDYTRPWLIEIGNQVTISDHVKILTHDYSWSVVAKKWPGEIYPGLGKVKIGNNVYVGCHSIILGGVNIGNNVVIGAGTIVTKDVPDDCVFAGNPGRVIESLQEYKDKQSKRVIDNLRILFYEYYDKYGSLPDEEIFYEFMTFYMKKEKIEEKYPQFYDRYKLEKIEYNPLFDGYDDMLIRLKERY